MDNIKIYAVFYSEIIFDDDSDEEYSELKLFRTYQDAYNDMKEAFESEEKNAEYIAHTDFNGWFSTLTTEVGKYSWDISEHEV